MDWIEAVAKACGFVGMLCISIWVLITGPAVRRLEHRCDYIEEQLGERSNGCGNFDEAPEALPGATEAPDTASGSQRVEVEPTARFD